MLIYMNAHGANAVLDTMGGELVGYNRNGVEYVWQGDPAYWPGHAPVLFPIVGALKNGTIAIEGKAYSMPKHGIARKSEFEITDQTEDSITFTLQASGESLQMYPFRFRLMVTHRLMKNGFQTTYTVVNEDGRDMPFCIGGHPGFNCPMHEGEGFEDYELLFDETECIPGLFTDAETLMHPNNTVELIQEGKCIPLRYSDFDQDAVILSGLRSKGVRLVHAKSGKGLHFTFDGFGALGIWTPPKKQAPFICLEPWAGLPAYTDETGLFLDKPYVMISQPGAAKSFHYAMSIVD